MINFNNNDIKYCCKKKLKEKTEKRKPTCVFSNTLVIFVTSCFAHGFRHFIVLLPLMNRAEGEFLISNKNVYGKIVSPVQS